tara:strand:+ start:85 stop:501 length:417 start_codon:yes stop_codon:yes gene_type:complete
MMTTAESLGYWNLPKPERDELKETKSWLPIPRVARTIPFGYKVDPKDNNILLPISEELEALEQAKTYLKQYSFREVANWLAKTTDRPISHVGLRKRIQNEQQRKRKITVKRTWAERLKKAIEAAEKIEKERVGAAIIS